MADLRPKRIAEFIEPFRVEPGRRVRLPRDFDPANDAKERVHWDDDQKAFSDVLSMTSTAWAPWYVIPADDKPFARVAAAGVIANALIEIDPRFPRVGAQAREALGAAKVELEAQAPPGAEPDPIEIELADKAARKKSKGKGAKGDKG